MQLHFSPIDKNGKMEKGYLRKAKEGTNNARQLR